MAYSGGMCDYYLWTESYWHLVDRGQGQDRPPQQRTIWPKMSIMLRLRNLALVYFCPQCIWAFISQSTKLYLHPFPSNTSSSVFPWTYIKHSLLKVPAILSNITNTEQMWLFNSWNMVDPKCNKCNVFTRFQKFTIENLKYIINNFKCFLRVKIV